MEDKRIKVREAEEPGLFVPQLHEPEQVVRRYGRNLRSESPELVPALLIPLLPQEFAGLRACNDGVVRFQFEISDRLLQPIFKPRDVRVGVNRAADEAPVP